MTNPIPIRGPHLQHDGGLKLAFGSSAKSRQWKTKDMLWSALVSRLSDPVRTPETVAEYHASPKSEQDRAKDVGGYLKGPASGGRRRSGSVPRLYLLALDIDSPEPGLIDSLQTLYDFAWVVHSTHSHREGRERLRLVAPIARPLSGDEWQAVARRLASELGLEQFDPTTFELERLNYWPSCPRDAAYVFETQDGPWLDPDAILGRYDNWRDPSQWPSPPRESRARERLAERAENPHDKRGVVGAFCRTFSVPGAIEAFLSEVYEAHEDGERYTYRAGSTAGGLVLYEGGKFAYSHHGTDPTGGRLVNAFDLVRLHKFGELDDEAAEGTPVVRMPSYLAMLELAGSDDRVRQTMGQERLAQAAQDFAGGEPANSDGDSEEEDSFWLSKLEVNSDGKVLPTRHNILTVLEHDPMLKGRIAFNEFSNRPTVLKRLPWRKVAARPDWQDSDDEGLRYYLERTYDIDRPAKVADALGVLHERHRFHPVRDYLTDQEWDGLPRVETLLIDYLGAEDSPYTRAVTRKALAAAVARIMRPGIKFDYMLVLVGPQGIGKSQLLDKLGRDWFSDSLSTVQGTEAYEQLQGAWIIEMGELAATRRAETEAIKHFLTKREDIYRVAYGRRTSVFPRQCVFFGTTNDAAFLRDRTGNRRFWPVVVGGGGQRSLWEHFSEAEIGQVWAEAVEIYRAGEELFLPPELEEQAREVQARHTEESELSGTVREYLDRPLPLDWADRTLSQRQQYLHGSDFEDRSGGVLSVDTGTRTAVCVMEVWVEALSGDPKQLKPGQARELHDIIRTTPGWAPFEGSRGRMTFPLYGRQRAYVREGF